MKDSPKIFPLGDSCVTVDFGNSISVELNTKAIALASYFERNPFPGFIESVPAYSSVAIFYNLIEVRKNFPEWGSAFHVVGEKVRLALQQPEDVHQTRSLLVEIPVDFSDRVALDLDFVAQHGGLSRADVIKRFTSRTYRVFMLGFLPGFAYMGEVDESIAVPRKDSPRTKVPKGSVGIASRQTGIYPCESPGGWQIIGRTDLEMFTPNNNTPCLLAAGDEVRFVPLA